MNESDFKQYADQELQKCLRYKKIWKRATNPRIRDKAFFAWCVKQFQLQQIYIYSPEPIPPENRFSMDEAVGLGISEMFTVIIWDMIGIRMYRLEC